MPEGPISSSAVARILKVILMRTENKQRKEIEEASVFLDNTYIFMNTIREVNTFLKGRSIGY